MVMAPVPHPNLAGWWDALRLACIPIEQLFGPRAEELRTGMNRFASRGNFAGAARRQSWTRKYWRGRSPVADRNLRLQDAPLRAARKQVRPVMRNRYVFA